MKISTVNYYLLLAVLLAPVCPADEQTALEELEPEAYFDFWLGNWHLTWEDSDGTLAKGSNRIERILLPGTGKCRTITAIPGSSGGEFIMSGKPGRIRLMIDLFGTVIHKKAAKSVLSIRYKDGMIAEVEDLIVQEVV